MARTLFDKVWDAHEIAVLPGGVSLLHVDRHLMHELTGVDALRTLMRHGLGVHAPALTFATLDHVTSTRPLARDGDEAWSTKMIDAMRTLAVEHGIKLFDADGGRKGIVHVIGPELGLTLPGLTVVCGDSHTCTHGAFGALAWGIGSSEVAHVLATQAIRQRRPGTLRINFRGSTPEGVSAKDIILHVIGALGAAAGTGYAVEYAGRAIRALDMEGRMTLCNLSIELGARMGLIAPDEVTFKYVAGREYAPEGALLAQAMEAWTALASEEDARFDRELEIDCTAIRPTVTWGTSPEHTATIDACVPDPAGEREPARREAWQRALDYMCLVPGQRIASIPIDHVFIGSCTNSRLSDLREAARVLRGRRIAAGTTGWVVPGSQQIKREAEREGLDRIFTGAGFQWREPGCSMCVGANGDMVPPGKRCVSTSNRNFVGRQGPGALTHLASPAIAAASAVAGHLAAPYMLERRA
ncbi:3-isopropylmalate dehydratase large subunit [Paracandidimonas lactea]|uniref:3-isopropylmalate dehydratase large subunit n=1 Tax=Paracandidimonas lactea TaxID=2895524 RepID=UPI001F0172A4|nr:3-isopropylmalate dehydratase large subunit [Paracandidimonas lactea]